jgi:hypothetical protein
VTKSAAPASHRVFELFVLSCRDAFDRQLALLGFSEPEIVVHPPDCAVRYSKADVKLVFHYEIGSRPWTTVEVRLPHGWQQLSLDRLVLAAAPELAVSLRTADETNAISIYAHFIGAHLQTLLSGDFSMLRP